MIKAIIFDCFGVLIEDTKNLPLLAYIKELKAKDLKVGLLSNVTDNWIRESFLTPKEQELFDDMVFSFEVGIAKPDMRIFELACKRLGTLPSETVMVDDIEHFCEAAHEIGMQTVIYQDFGQLKRELNAILSNS